jgi:hypothetical protein
VPREQLLDIVRRYLAQRQTDRASGDRHAPERIAELLRHGVTVEHAALHEVLAHVGEHFAGFLGESCRGVEQALIVGERLVDRARGGVLLDVEVVGLAHA